MSRRNCGAGGISARVGNVSAAAEPVEGRPGSWCLIRSRVDLGLREVPDWHSVVVRGSACIRCNSQAIADKYYTASPLLQQASCCCFSVADTKHRVGEYERRSVLKPALVVVWVSAAVPFPASRLPR